MLATDHYAPRDATRAGTSFPTVLIRTPYGKGLAPAFHARRFAERGYHVVVQDVRGRFGSGGEFEPFLNESKDGTATLGWLNSQPWFNGVLGTWGQSYLAYTQWALAAAAPDAVNALFPSLPSSRGPFSGQVDDAQLLELPLRWMVVLEALRHMPGGQGSFSPWRTLWRLSSQGQDRTLADAFAHVPLAECDVLAIGEQIPYFRHIMNSATPAHWEQADFRGRLAKIRQPIHLLGGWYDFMLDDMLRDYGELRTSGHVPFLTIGPWHHVHPEISRVTLREGLAWFDAHLKGEPHRLRHKAVKVYLMGAGEWRYFDNWPPPSQQRSLFLRSSNRLSFERPPLKSAPDIYTYDPADPTPAVGGALFYSGAGPRDNRDLEARADVLSYTSAVLEHDVDVVGPVMARLHIFSTRDYSDVFVRLCDVYPDGRSMNVCDGIIRLYPGKVPTVDGGVLSVEVAMSATAHRFRRGHAIRLQISSGAHPRFAPNPGTANAPKIRGEMFPSQQSVYHDARHPSTLVLPLI